MNFDPREKIVADITFRMRGRIHITRLGAFLLALLAEADVGSAFNPSYSHCTVKQISLQRRKSMESLICRSKRRVAVMSAGTDANDSALWASLKKRIGSDSAESLTLPTADKMVDFINFDLCVLLMTKTGQDPKAVVTTVLRSLEQNDHPHENHGIETFLSYSSPIAKVGVLDSK